MKIDGDLLKPRRQVRATPCDDGLGYDVELACKHTIWIATLPAGDMVCGACLNKLIEQVREVQAQQRIE